MEIKHTIEILTKDIQDIEKLVRNLNNYTTPPQIELDLAMSKLRRVYDLLSTISSDIKTDHDEVEKTTREVEQVIDNQSNHLAEDTNDLLINQEAELVPDPLIEEEAPSIDQSEVEEAVSSPKKQKEASILAEKFETDKSLNEKIAPGINSDLDTKIKGGPIDSIKRNIGINDRFLIIRELMNGDNEGFNQIVQKLDDCTNFNEAFKHIQSRFPDDLEHESVMILINLSRRKFISRGNV